MMNAASQPKQKEDASQPSAQPVELTEEAFEKAWEAIVSELKPKLRALLTSVKHEFNKEEATLTQFVANDLQRDWIMSNMHFILEDKLRKALGGHAVKILVEVLPPEQVKVNTEYMPTEVAKAMIKDSPQMESFSREFDLDVS